MAFKLSEHLRKELILALGITTENIEKEAEIDTFIFELMVQAALGSQELTGKDADDLTEFAGTFTELGQAGVEYGLIRRSMEHKIKNVLEEAPDASTETAKLTAQKVILIIKDSATQLANKQFSKFSHVVRFIDEAVAFIGQSSKATDSTVSSVLTERVLEDYFFSLDAITILEEWGLASLAKKPSE